MSVWGSAMKGVSKHQFYLTESCNFMSVHGVGPVIAGIFKQAPWSTFNPSSPSRPPLFIKPKGDTEAAFSMDDVVTMDLETASVLDTKGNFLVYAVGWSFHGQYHSRVASTSEELQTNGVLWDALTQWSQLGAAVGVPATASADPDVDVSVPKLGRIYVYAHNGSRFDSVLAMNCILANSKDMPTDQLMSNGKLISFTYNNLVFRDSCLLTLSSLKDAAAACGAKSSKGYLPHGYLQNCASADEVLQRINGIVPWRMLEPFCDWFHDLDDAELHKRVAGRTWEQWRDQQPFRRSFNPDALCDFRSEMEVYLKQDVQCLTDVVSCIGGNMAAEYGADIRIRCTLGSLAELIWQRTLAKPLPKLMDEALHLLWQKVNRGGFCAPLSSFDYTAAAGEKLFKVDVVSLHPSSASRIVYITSAGPQEPLKDWYTGFPDPTDGWLQHDFQGQCMTDAQDKELKSMHGVVRVRFNQSRLPFPFFLQKMREGNWETLAPVMQGEDYYITPHV